METTVIHGVPAGVAESADWVEWPLGRETISFNDGERVCVCHGDRVLVGVFADGDRYVSVFFDIQRRTVH